MLMWWFPAVMHTVTLLPSMKEHLNVDLKMMNSNHLVDVSEAFSMTGSGGYC